MDSKQAQIYLLGWVADYPDEETFLQLFFGKNAGVNGINSSNYQNPAYDALYETAEVMNPGPERDALYRKLEAIVMEDSPWLLVNYSTAYALHYRWLHNVKPMDFCYGNLMYRSLDFADRAAWFRHH